MAWKHRLVSKNIPRMTGVCAVCGPVALKWRSGNGAGKPRTVCCATAKKISRQSPSRDRWAIQKAGTNYGMTLEESREFKKGKVCAICGSDKRLSVDHCHVTGNVRDVLCHGCNSGLGFFRDDPVRLARAIEYLASHAPR